MTKGDNLKIYIVCCRAVGGAMYYKVGITFCTTEKRIKELQTGCPLVISEYITFTHVKNGRNKEKQIHKRFKHKQTIGERFNLCGRDIGVICNIITGKKVRKKQETKIFNKMTTNKQYIKERLRRYKYTCIKHLRNNFWAENPSYQWYQKDLKREMFKKGY